MSILIVAIAIVSLLQHPEVLIALAVITGFFVWVAASQPQYESPRDRTARVNLELKRRAEARREAEHRENIEIKRLQRELLRARIGKVNNDVVKGDMEIEKDRPGEKFTPTDYPS